ncbi:MAG: hypothetical protein M1814_000812 [Vezdaea aestivalis]|nr:MAG: hypothetical protein M1814_000812 [Vezdaea aestivalis]
MAHRRSPSLEIPRKSLEDPGAHDLESSDTEEDHFSDAREGRASGTESPIPTTRVEKVDDTPRHGELPGTEAYKLRAGDAVPDEIEIQGKSSREGSRSRQSSSAGAIPLTVVEKIDPEFPSHGEVPGTAAHSVRIADAVPDIVLRASDSSLPPSPSITRPRSDSTPGDLPIPTTKVSKISTLPAHGEVSGTLAYNKRLGDAEPDAVEEVQDQSSRRPSLSSNAHRNELAEVSDDDGFGDDFDDFEEGADGFDEFEAGFHEPQSREIAPPATTESGPVLALNPLLDFEELDSPSEIVTATSEYLAGVFDVEVPKDGHQKADPLSDGSVFLTERSASLWAQLVAAPPVQSPNWLRSRIRRLFLVSLGVPVDLDEVLPASKQKKLVLPSARIGSSQSPRPSSDGQPSGSLARLKRSNGSSSSVGSRSKSKQRKSPAVAPQLDKAVVSDLCSYGSDKVQRLSDEELADYVRNLEEQKRQAGIVLEYWLKQKDTALGDKEAFEGVIENLVKHARKIRK